VNGVPQLEKRLRATFLYSEIRGIDPKTFYVDREQNNVVRKGGHDMGLVRVAKNLYTSGEQPRRGGGGQLKGGAPVSRSAK